MNFSDYSVKQLVEEWGDAHGLDAIDLLSLHLGDAFEASHAHVLSAEVEDGALWVTVTVDNWKKPKLLALLETGSMIWSPDAPSGTESRPED